MARSKPIFLNQRLNQLLIRSFAVIIFSVLLVVVAVYFQQSNREAITTEGEITKHLNEQIGKLVIPFLIPEQKVGLPFIVDKIKESEQLIEATILNNNWTPEENCLIKKNYWVCEKNDSTLVVAPIEESGKVYGYFSKRKANLKSPFQVWFPAQVAIIFTILFFAFIVIFYQLAKVTTKDIPHAIQNLITSTDSHLSGNGAKTNEHQYQEFQNLANQLEILYCKHKSSEQQAILGKMVSGILHDIKTPLQPILSAYYLLKESESDREKKLELLIRSLDNRLDYIVEVINKSLDANREIRLNSRLEDLRSTLNESLDQNKHLYLKSGVKVEIQIPSDPVLIPHDVMQIKRVFSNLLINAVQAQENKDTKAIFISLIKNKNSILFAMEDNGPGILNSNQDWNDFRSTKSSGTGLGLFICQKILELHSTKLRIAQSVTLKGARFEIQFQENYI